MVADAFRLKLELELQLPGTDLCVSLDTRTKAVAIVGPSGAGKSTPSQDSGGRRTQSPRGA